jgi:DNA repair protein RadC
VAIELGKRLTYLPAENRVDIQNPDELMRLIHATIALEEREVMLGIKATADWHVARMETLYRGTASKAVIRASEIVRWAVLNDVEFLVVAHNHPYGAARPSQADLDTTKNLVQACKIMNIQLLDHIIVNDRGEHYSFQENGKL